MDMYCTSGRHRWLSAVNADKCCNGWRRVFIFPAAKEACVGTNLRTGEVPCGMGWIRISEANVPETKDFGRGGGDLSEADGQDREAAFRNK